MDTPRILLNEDEQKFLLESARRTIIHYVTHGSVPQIACDNAKLNEKCGAFVTLHEKNGGLRGCIGYVEPVKPLVQTIIDMAVACSTRDPRFHPVTPNEFANLSIEISVLSPLEQVHDPESISVGVHGILVKKDYASGLLLPQVAVEFGWDRLRFLKETCRKAGLPPDAWKHPDSRLYIFSAQIFGADLLL